jgi:hypothetical protein
MGSGRRHYIGGKSVALAERRGSLVKLLIALFVARIVVTITEIIESEVTVFSAVISRELITFVFLGVLVAGYLSVRPTFRDEPA